MELHVALNCLVLSSSALLLVLHCIPALVFVLYQCADCYLAGCVFKCIWSAYVQVVYAHVPLLCVRVCLADLLPKCTGCLHCPSCPGVVLCMSTFLGTVRVCTKDMCTYIDK